MNNTLSDYKDLIEEMLENALPAAPGENPLYPVMRYGIRSPGKRIRGILTMLFCERLGVPEQESLPFAAALEMIHAYSLVHDDMPEMDNDMLRRGKPSCHAAFGQAKALLAGDGILNFSMEFLLSKRSLYQPSPFLAALSALYSRAGAQGMLGGQVLDMEGESKSLSIDELLSLHRHKTGALLEAPYAVASALSGRTSENYVNYCRHLGLAFQIKDDLLDLDGDPGILGKNTGKDAGLKSTFVTLLGREEANRFLNREIEGAVAQAGEDRVLKEIAEFVGSRNQ